jgi:hypothetical protein
MQNPGRLGYKIIYKIISIKLYMLKIFTVYVAVFFAPTAAAVTAAGDAFEIAGIPKCYAGSEPLITV